MDDMPNLAQCLEYYGDKYFYVETGYEFFKGEHSDWEEYIKTTVITPIISDPTDVDSDKDGYVDGSTDVLKDGKVDDPRPLLCDVKTIKLSNPELLIVTDGEKEYYGANQGWFDENETIRNKGCGIVAISNIFSYMAGSDSDYSALFSGERTKSNFIKYISEISDYLKIGPVGIWGIKHISKGATAYAEAKEVDLQPKISYKFFTAKNAADYIVEGLEDNKPVAMLIGINFRLQEVEIFGLDGAESISSINTHWVTITEIEIDNIKEKYTVKVSTWGEYAYVDLKDYVNGELYWKTLVYFY